MSGYSKDEIEPGGPLRESSFPEFLIRFASSGLRSGERLLMIHRITGNPLVQNDLEKKDRASAKLKQF